MLCSVGLGRSMLPQMFMMNTSEIPQVYCKLEHTYFFNAFNANDSKVLSRPLVTRS